MATASPAATAIVTWLGASCIAGSLGSSSSAALLCASGSDACNGKLPWCEAGRTRRAPFAGLVGERYVITAIWLAARRRLAGWSQDHQSACHQSAGLAGSLVLMYPEIQRRSSAFTAWEMRCT